MYKLSGLEKSSPPQNRQLIVSNRDSKQQVDDAVGEWTFFLSAASYDSLHPSDDLLDEVASH